MLPVGDGRYLANETAFDIPVGRAAALVARRVETFSQTEETAETGETNKTGEARQRTAHFSLERKFYLAHNKKRAHAS